MTHDPRKERNAYAYDNNLSYQFKHLYTWSTLDIRRNHPLDWYHHGCPPLFHHPFLGSTSSPHLARPTEPRLKVRPRRDLRNEQCRARSYRTEERPKASAPWCRFWGGKVGGGSSPAFKLWGSSNYYVTPQTIKNLMFPIKRHVNALIFHGFEGRL